MNNKKKIVLIVIAALIVVLGAGIYFISASQSPDYTKQYTEEEWLSLSEAERQIVVKRRACDPDSNLRSTGIDCSKY